MYIVISAVVARSPYLQRVSMYLSWFQMPLTTFWLPLPEMRLTDLQNLRSWRLGHFARNVTITTPDGEVLRAWHLAPTRLAPQLTAAGCGDKMSRDEAFENALRSQEDPIILYLHGQGFTRGMLNRVHLAQALCGELQAHVLMLDYRGFGGSTGSPSQTGLLTDAAAAWAWILGFSQASRIFVYGHSLGAAVAIHLAASLNGEQSPAGLVLDAPFSNAVGAAMKHPFYFPFRLFPPIISALARSLADKWECRSAIKNTNSPILMFAGGRDRICGKTEAGLLRAAALQAEGIADTKRMLQYVEVPQASHSNIFAEDEWLVAMTNFVHSCRGRS